MKANFVRLTISSLFLAFCMQQSSTAQQGARQTYFIAFVSEDGDWGHAFVMWGIQVKPGIWYGYDAVGQWPKENSTIKASATLLPSFGHVPNLFKNGFEGELVEPKRFTHQITVPVSESVFFKSYHVKDAWAKRDYSLISTDCVSFLRDIAQAAGLRTPDRLPGTLSPSAYVSALAEANADIPGQYFGPFPKPDQLPAPLTDPKKSAPVPSTVSPPKSPTSVIPVPPLTPNPTPNPPARPPSSSTDTDKHGGAGGTDGRSSTDKPGPPKDKPGPSKDKPGPSNEKPGPSKDPSHDTVKGEKIGFMADDQLEPVAPSPSNGYAWLTPLGSHVGIALLAALLTFFWVRRTSAY